MTCVNARSGAHLRFAPSRRVASCLPVPPSGLWGRTWGGIIVVLAVTRQTVVAYYSHCEYSSPIGSDNAASHRENKMKHIDMTDEQTALYDADDASVLRELIAKAQAVANSSGEMVEVYTADGIVAASVTPDR